MRGLPRPRTPARRLGPPPCWRPYAVGLAPCPPLVSSAPRRGGPARASRCAALYPRRGACGLVCLRAPCAFGRALKLLAAGGIEPPSTNGPVFITLRLPWSAPLGPRRNTRRGLRGPPPRTPCRRGSPAPPPPARACGAPRDGARGYGTAVSRPNRAGLIFRLARRRFHAGWARRARVRYRPLACGGPAPPAPAFYRRRSRVVRPTPSGVFQIDGGRKATP